MKKKTLKWAGAVFLLLTGMNTARAQTPPPLKTKLIKFVDRTYMGSTDTVDNMPILVNTNGNIVVSGNQKISATQYDATTIEQLSSGIQNWINQVNASGQKSFIVASCNDAGGNVYNAGAFRSTTSNGLDFFIQKVNAAGNTVWTQYYDNGANDGASAICVDGSGNVYVTGASEGTGFVDYATVCFDGSGNQKWATRYDYSSLIDVPTAIFYNAALGRVVVTGSSANSFADWDFATVQYNAGSGAQTDVDRVPGGAGSDKLLGATMDAQGNIYSVGTAFNGTNYDLQLVKLDTAFNQVFVKTFDSYGQDDAGVAVALDSKGNILVVGTSYVQPGKTELLIVKYDKNGNKVWEKHRPGIGGQASEGLRLQIKSDNAYFVAGNYGSGVTQNVALLCYDSLGYVTLETEYDDSGFRDRLMDMTFDGNHIYLTARSMASASAPTEQNMILHYEYTDITQNITVVGSGVSEQRYVEQELIISFNKKACRMTTINDRGQTFGKLNEFVADSTCDKISNALDPDKNRDINARNFPVRKIFFDLTEADSISETRMGNTVKIPEFYTSLLITLPINIITTNAVAPLNNLPGDIRYTQLNNVFKLASPPTPPPTNDPEFPVNQGALHPTALYPNAHINADTAWTITTGEPFVKIGFLDSGIQPGHQDLPSNIQGYDFYANTSLGNGDLDDHGTPVAGTAVAIRNNGFGVASVAGGDASANKPGATAYDCRVTQGGFPPENAVAAGMLKASTGTNAGGFGVHILNIGFYYGGYAYIDNWGHGVAAATIEQLNFANRNGVVVNCPKSNMTVGTNIFPADWSDDIIMSIGSNGKDGHHCKSLLNCTNNSTTGGQIDFVAPGTGQLVRTTSSQGTIISEHGTSQATPHVSGASALIQGYRNKPTPDWNNLVHEDIEHILQRTATDLDSTLYSEKPGYDTVTGWGRINVYRAIRELNKNYYRIKHISETIGNTSAIAASPTLVYADTMTWINYPGLATGVYTTEVYERKVVINYALLPSEKLIDGWPLNKECYGVRFYQHFVDADRPNYSRIDSLTPTSCTMTTYYYKIPSKGLYMPYEPGRIKSAFSVYTYDSTGMVGIRDYGDKLVNYSRFKVFPNPNKGNFVAEFNSDFTETLTYKITNILGQEVDHGEYRATLGINQIKINSHTMTNGVYIFTIFNGNQELHKQKIIKQD